MKCILLWVREKQRVRLMRKHAQAHAGQRELRCIGATTLNEYRMHVEKDAALGAFSDRIGRSTQCGRQHIHSSWIGERFEIHHGVNIRDEALVQAAVLSNRYVSERFLPDKAIDLVDEACAMIRTELDSMPAELDEISRRVLQLEIEETALNQEKDNSSKDRLEVCARNSAMLGIKWKPSNADGRMSVRA